LTTRQKASSCGNKHGTDEINTTKELLIAAINGMLHDAEHRTTNGTNKENDAK
jgi:hypothetical protein